MTRLKNIAVKDLWEDYKKKYDFLVYFPDRFQKTPPPKAYFFKVLFVYDQSRYQQIIDDGRKRIQKRIFGIKKITVTKEATLILETYQNKNMAVMMEIKKRKQLSIAQIMSRRNSKKAKKISYFAKKMQNKNRNSGTNSSILEEMK